MREIAISVSKKAQRRAIFRGDMNIRARFINLLRAHAIRRAFAYLPEDTQKGEDGITVRPAQNPVAC
jgi:hypothetical protein